MAPQPNLNLAFVMTHTRSLNHNLSFMSLLAKCGTNTSLNLSTSTTAMLSRATSVSSNISCRTISTGRYVSRVSSGSKPLGRSYDTRSTSTWFSGQISRCASVKLVSHSDVAIGQRRGFHWSLSRVASNTETEKRPSVSTTSSSSSTSSTQSSPILAQIKANALPITTKHENIYTIPNFLTFTRLLSAPGIAYFILTSQPVPAVILFTYAGFTDLLDGYLARRYNSHTVVGSVIDPMADKTLMMATTIALYVSGVFPWWLVTIILGRDIGLAISAIYFRWISLPPPKTMTRYWDFSLPSAEVNPTEISKINTLLQLCLVGTAMVLPVLPETIVAVWNLQGVFEGWQYLVAGTTVWSGLSYVGSKDAVKILSQEEGERRKEETMKKLKGEL